MEKLRNLAYALLLMLAPSFTFAIGPIPGNGGTPVDQYDTALVAVAVGIISLVAYKVLSKKAKA